MAPLIGGVENLLFSYNTSFQQIIRGEQTLKRGDKGGAVEALQQALVDMGFGIQAFVDGKFGPKTETLLKNFQDSVGLRQTGVLDAPTLKALNRMSPPLGKTLGAYAKECIKPLETLGIPQARKVGDTYIRVIADKSQHRAFFYSREGRFEEAYPIATGTGVGDSVTDTMLKKVVKKFKGTDLEKISKALWPEGKGRTFGTHLLDLHPASNTSPSAIGKEDEAHGTYLENSLGENASHGCIRFSNKHMEWMYNEINTGEYFEVQA